MSEEHVLERIRQLEAQVRLLSEKLGVPYGEVPDAMPEEVVRLAREDKRLQAINRYRELTGADLTTAQRAVASIT